MQFNAARREGKGQGGNTTVFLLNIKHLEILACSVAPCEGENLSFSLILLRGMRLKAMSEGSLISTMYKGVLARVGAAASRRMGGGTVVSLSLLGDSCT
jgi:hypothetical protein